MPGLSQQSVIVHMQAQVTLRLILRDPKTQVKVTSLVLAGFSHAIT